MTLAMNTVHQGDCLDLLRQLPDGSIGLVVTSPPYNLGLVGTMTKGGKGHVWRNPVLLTDGYADDPHRDALPRAEYVRQQREMLAECMRALKANGAIYYNHKFRIIDGRLIDHRDILDGLPVRQIIIWDRGCGFNTNPSSYTSCYEVIYLIAQPDFRLAKPSYYGMRRKRTGPPEGGNTGDVWRININSSIRGRPYNPHPAAWPLELPRRCILTSGTPGPVLDPYLGSGTTALAAIECGVPWIGFERSPEYVEMARERIARAQLTLSL